MQLDKWSSKLDGFAIVTVLAGLAATGGAWSRSTDGGDRVVDAGPDWSAEARSASTCARVTNLPRGVTVVAAGGYRGRELDWQIDQSGHQATRIDATVTTPGRVALVVGAYEPTIWNIGWTQGTEIVAVIATGYHRQAIAGLPAGVPVRESTYDGGAPCGSFDDVEVDDVEIVARRVLGQPVVARYPVDEDAGRVVIGPPPSGRVVWSGDRSVASYRDPDAPLAGPAGLAALVDQGKLRRARAAELAELAFWCREDELVHGLDVYVVTGALSFPAGLHGARSATFFVPDGAPMPTGDRGHSTVIARRPGPTCTTL